MTIPPSVSCSACGALLYEPTDLNAELREPCRDCGSLGRKISVGANDEIGFLHGSLATKLVRGATGKVAQEQFVGASQSADGTFAEVNMVRNYETYQDDKRVVLADGTVERDVHGDLRDHRGRGSDRPELRAAREAAQRAKAEARAARKQLRDVEWRNRQSPE